MTSISNTYIGYHSSSCLTAHTTDVPVGGAAFIAHATQHLRKTTVLLRLEKFMMESAQKYKGNRRRLARSVAAYVMACVRICS